MFYVSKQKERALFTEKTHAETVSGLFNLGEEPTANQLRRFYVAFFMVVVMALAHCSGIGAADYETVAENGAGTNWTCSRCGGSNKVYEMSCSNCGYWR